VIPKLINQVSAQKIVLSESDSDSDDVMFDKLKAKVMVVIRKI